MTYERGDRWDVKCLTCGAEWDMNFDSEACTCQAGDEMHQLRITDATGSTGWLTQPADQRGRQHTSMAASQPG